MKDRVKAIMAVTFRVDEKLLSDNVEQNDIVNWDSLAHLNLIIALENEFDISFEPEEIRHMTSMNSIIKCIKSHKE